MYFKAKHLPLRLILRVTLSLGAFPEKSGQAVAKKNSATKALSHQGSQRTSKFHFVKTLLFCETIF